LAVRQAPFENPGDREHDVGGGDNRFVAPAVLLPGDLDCLQVASIRQSHGRTPSRDRGLGQAEDLEEGPPEPVRQVDALPEVLRRISGAAGEAGRS
jgi:hypothetical protein